MEPDNQCSMKRNSNIHMFYDFRTHGVTGSVKVNGKERSVRKFRKQLCYITQEFAMLDLLTARETLVVAADLKLNSDIGTQKKNKMVCSVKLTNCKVCMVG
jgi:ABC-type multidrug transport system, ATPase component